MFSIIQAVWPSNATQRVVTLFKRTKFENNPVCAQEFLESLPCVTNGFCVDCLLAPSKVGGYIQLSWEGANKFCTLGEMLGWAAGKYTTRPTDQISHRCHNPRCSIPAHVVVESAADNNRRKGCLVFVDCPHGCPEKILVCPHKPCCIRFVPGYETWDEFFSGGIHETK